MRIMNYYEMVNHKHAVSHLRHNPVIKNFNIELYAIKECKKKEVATPHIIQKLDIVRWNESFLDFLSRIVGDTNIPLACVVRTIDNEDYDAPFDLRNENCCAEDAGSLEVELIKRALHSHPSFKEDNAAVYCRLEETTKSTVHSALSNLLNERKMAEILGCL